MVGSVGVQEIDRGPEMRSVEALRLRVSSGAPVASRREQHGVDHVNLGRDANRNGRSSVDPKYAWTDRAPLTGGGHREAEASHERGSHATQ